MLRTVIGCTVFLFAVASFAVDLIVKDGDQILVRGPAAQVHYTVIPGATALKVVSPVGWTLERREQVLAIEDRDMNSRAEVRDAIKLSAAKSKVVEISGPSLPAEIHLREGSVNLTKNTREVRVLLQQGKVVAHQLSGGLRVSGRKVELSLTDLTGRLDVDIYQGAVTIKGHQGDGKIELFSGNLISENENGTLSFLNQNGNSKIQKFTGTLHLELDKGSFNALGLQGRVEGKTGDASSVLQIATESDVNLTSASGRVSVQLPPSSGASLNLLTQGGDIAVPAELHVVRAATEKSVKGKLKGDGGRNQVIVRSTDGSIVVK